MHDLKYPRRRYNQLWPCIAIGVHSNNWITCMISERSLNESLSCACPIPSMEGHIHASCNQTRPHTLFDTASFACKSYIIDRIKDGVHTACRRCIIRRASHLTTKEYLLYCLLCFDADSIMEMSYDLQQSQDRTWIRNYMKEWPPS